MGKRGKSRKLAVGQTKKKWKANGGALEQDQPSSEQGEAMDTTGTRVEEGGEPTIKTEETEENDQTVVLGSDAMTPEPGTETTPKLEEIAEISDRKCEEGSVEINPSNDMNSAAHDGDNAGTTGGPSPNPYQFFDDLQEMDLSKLSEDELLVLIATAKVGNTVLEQEIEMKKKRQAQLINKMTKQQLKTYLLANI